MIKCGVCGETNPSNRALCSKCHSPLLRGGGGDGDDKTQALPNLDQILASEQARTMALRPVQGPVSVVAEDLEDKTMTVDYNQLQQGGNPVLAASPSALPPLRSGAPGLPGLGSLPSAPSPGVSVNVGDELDDDDEDAGPTMALDINQLMADPEFVKARNQIASQMGGAVEAEEPRTVAMQGIGGPMSPPQAAPPMPSHAPPMAAAAPPMPSHAPPMPAAPAPSPQIPADVNLHATGDKPNFSAAELALNAVQDENFNVENDYGRPSQPLDLGTDGLAEIADLKEPEAVQAAPPKKKGGMGLIIGGVVFILLGLGCAGGVGGLYFYDNTFFGLLGDKGGDVVVDDEEEEAAEDDGDKADEEEADKEEESGDSEEETEEEEE